MARTDNLTNYLTDVADAIREKKGTTETISASNFDEEIKNLPSGGGDIEEYLNTSVANGKSSYFGTRHLVKRVPQLTLDSGVTTIDSMFLNMEGIEEIDVFDTSNVTNMSSTFKACRALKKIPLLNTSKVTNMDSCFSTCNAITEVPNLDFSNVKNMGSAFQYCIKLKTVPDLNTPNLTYASYMFGNCNALESLGEIDGSSLVNISQMFQVGKPMTTFGGIKDLGKAYLTTQSASYSNYGLTLSTCTYLTHDSLMNVINKLYDIASIGVKPQNLILGSTNLAKLTSDEISIAQNKGWNVS